MKRTIAIVALALIAAGAWAQNWEAHRSEDLMSGNVVVMIYQTADATQNTLRDPTLIVRRSAGGMIEMYIIWGGYSMAEDRTLRLRVGDGPARNVRYGLSTNSEATFLREAETLLAELLTLPPATAIVAQANRRTGVASVARWYVGDLREAARTHLAIE